MTVPAETDRATDGTLGREHLDREIDRSRCWCVAGIDDVRANMASTEHPEERNQLMKGPVEVTIPERLSEELIALLRLDTDWYGSTRHELMHLFALLREGGVLIVDDDSHWEGARRAVDEYLGKLPHKYYMHSIYTGRLLVKR